MKKGYLNTYSQPIFSKEVKPLEFFLQDYPMATGLLYRGKKFLQLGRIPCIPHETFLKRLHPNQLITQTFLT